MEKPKSIDCIDSENPEAMEFELSHIDSHMVAGEKESSKVMLFGDLEIHCNGGEERSEKAIPCSKSLSLTVSISVSAGWDRCLGDRTPKAAKEDEEAPSEEKHSLSGARNQDPSTEMVSVAAPSSVAFSAVEAQKEKVKRELIKGKKILSNFERPNILCRCSSSRIRCADATSTSDLSAEIWNRIRRLLGNGLNLETQKQQVLSSSLTECSSSKTVCAAAANETQEDELKGECKGKRVVSEVDKPIKKRRCSSSGITDGVVPSTSILSRVLRDRISQFGDYDPKLVIEKKLTACDVTSAQGRLTMPENQITGAFLTDDEREIINSVNEEGKPKGIETVVIDPLLRTREIKLRKWCYRKTASYVMVSGWNKVVTHNRLLERDTVQVWSFRKEGKLAFALVNLGQNTTTLALSMAAKWGRTKKRSQPSDV